MPNNDFEGNMSHFILIAPTNKNIMLPKIAFQNLGTTKLHLGSQDPGSRKFSCPAPPLFHRLANCDQFLDFDELQACRGSLFNQAVDIYHKQLADNGLSNENVSLDAISRRASGKLALDIIELYMYVTGASE